MKARRFLPLALSLAILVLEALPTGAVLRFGQPGGEAIVETFAYFSFTPFGYANFGPLLTAALSLVLAVLSLLLLLREKRGLWPATALIAILALFTSLLPLLMFGREYFSAVGLFISLLLALETLLAFSTLRKL